MNDDELFVVDDDRDLEKIAGVIRTKEHRQSLVEILRSNAIVEHMEDGVVAHTVLAGRRGDEWLSQLTSYLVKARTAR